MFYINWVSEKARKKIYILQISVLKFLVRLLLYFVSICFYNQKRSKGFLDEIHQFL